MLIRSIPVLRLAGAAMIASALVFSACSGDGDDSGDASAAQEFAITLTKEGCSPASIEAKAGQATFVVTNKGAAAVTEFEILDGDRILGEVENVIEGLKKSVTLNLKAGEYITYCPGGTANEKGTLVVK